ncbi:MAG: LCP family protein, partial [Propionibacteriaceae bacterium]|nr:LCP family protein [Propionibacteriaceae bacterium]
RVWVGLWVLLLGTGLGAVVWRSGVVSVLTSVATLRLVQLAMIVLGIGWGFLLIDAWRISRPPELARRHRQAFAVLSSTVVFVVVGGLLASASIISAQRDLMAAVFSGGGDTKAKNGRFNILLMGGDAGKGRVGLRPDSMTVASVDEVTGRTVLFSLPRNLEDTPFPAASPMHKKFPSGFSCPDRSCLLNAVYTYANQHKDLYPGVQDPGVQATKEAIEGATGLTINYYVLVDMRGFQALVDAVGGIRMDINTRVPIGGGSSKVSGYIEPGKNVRLDGYHALWFGRSRSDSSDYARMARQKCVMSAMLNQLDPFTVLTKFNKMASAGKEIMETDIPTSDINTLLDLALKAKSLPVSSLAFVPPLIRPGSPRFDLIQERVRAKIAAAEAADTGGKPAAEASPSRLATSGSTTSASAKGKKSAAKSSKPPTTGPETDDLTGICLAR